MRSFLLLRSVPLRMAFLRCSVLCAALCAASGAWAQYKWTNEDGGVSYGDRPPPSATDVQRIGPGARDDDDPLAGLPFELKRAATSYPVVLYTSENCPPCMEARNLLRARGIPFSEKTVSTLEDAEELKRRGFGDRVPIVTVGAQTRKGFEPKDWDTLLDLAQYPKTSQLPRNWRAPAPRPVVERSAAPGDANAPNTSNASNAPEAPGTPYSPKAPGTGTPGQRPAQD